MNIYKEQILQHIKKQCDELDNLEISQKLYEYTSRGKLLRGMFVCLSAESFGRKVDEEVLDVAAAIELAQTALLIHDDIMDQDNFRRGKPSMHKIYEQEGFNSHASTSLAICLGDVVLFHLFRYLNKDISVLFSKELTKTALGQTFDVAKASSSEEISEEDILYIIQNKTANYTFALPFSAGLILANRQDLQDSITELSRLMGLIFQIKDDILNYLPQSQIGKSSGGDIRENKKTLCRLMLIEQCPEAKDFYGKDVDKVIELYISSGVQQKIECQLSEYASSAEEIIRSLPIKSEYLDKWNHLLEYLKDRKF